MTIIQLLHYNGYYTYATVNLLQSQFFDCGFIMFSSLSDILLQGAVLGLESVTCALCSILT